MTPHEEDASAMSSTSRKNNKQKKTFNREEQVTEPSTPLICANITFHKQYFMSCRHNLKVNHLTSHNGVKISIFISAAPQPVTTVKSFCLWAESNKVSKNHLIKNSISIAQKQPFNRHVLQGFAQVTNQPWHNEGYLRVPSQGYKHQCIK